MTCSSPVRNLLTFWVAGTLDPEESASVTEHVATCSDCRIEAEEARRLIEGLHELHLQPDDVVAAAADEGDFPHLVNCRRCRDEVALLRSVNVDLERIARPGWRHPWLAGLAAAASIILAVVVGRHFAGRTSPLPPSQAVAVKQPAATPPAAKIRVEKASITLLAADVLVVRGKRNARQQLLEDLAASLAPYQQNDFAGAAARLRGLALKYPQASEPAYYLGVCLLLLDRPAEAIAPLETATRLASPPDEARYYLAVAHVNAGDVETGVAALRQLCDARKDISGRACTSLEEATGGRR